MQEGLKLVSYKRAVYEYIPPSSGTKFLRFFSVRYIYPIKCNYPNIFLGRFQDLLVAMKALGLNPTETEIQDLINEVERNGFIYYPAFCRVIMRKLREDDEENFRRELFRTMIGPKKYDDCVAPIYNYSREVLTFEQVRS